MGQQASSPHTVAPSNDMHPVRRPGFRFYPPHSMKLPFTTTVRDDLCLLHHSSLVIAYHQYFVCLFCIYWLRIPLEAGAMAYTSPCSILAEPMCTRHSSRHRRAISDFLGTGPGNHRLYAGRFEPQVRHSSFFLGVPFSGSCTPCSHAPGESAVHLGGGGKTVTNTSFSGLWTGKD